MLSLLFCLLAFFVPMGQISHRADCHVTGDIVLERLSSALQTARLSNWYDSSPSSLDATVDVILAVLSVAWVVLLLALLGEATRRYKYVPLRTASLGSTLVYHARCGKKAPPPHSQVECWTVKAPFGVTSKFAGSDHNHFVDPRCEYVTPPAGAARQYGPISAVLPCQKSSQSLESSSAAVCPKFFMLICSQAACWVLHHALRKCWMRWPRSASRAPTQRSP